jgi:hypothetical protein
LDWRTGSRHSRAISDHRRKAGLQVGRVETAEERTTLFVRLKCLSKPDINVLMVLRRRARRMNREAVMAIEATVLPLTPKAEALAA